MYVCMYNDSIIGKYHDLVKIAYKYLFSFLVSIDYPFWTVDSLFLFFLSISKRFHLNHKYPAKKTWKILSNQKVNLKS